MVYLHFGFIGKQGVTGLQMSHSAHHLGFHRLQSEISFMALSSLGHWLWPCWRFCRSPLHCAFRFFGFSEEASSACEWALEQHQWEELFLVLARILGAGLLWKCWIAVHLTTEQVNGVTLHVHSYVVQKSFCLRQCPGYIYLYVNKLHRKRYFWKPTW